VAKNDKKTNARAAAILKLAHTGSARYKSLMKASLKDQSYTVIAAGVLGLQELEPTDAEKALADFDEDTKNHVTKIITKFNKKRK